MFMDYRFKTLHNFYNRLYFYKQNKFCNPSGSVTVIVLLIPIMLSSFFVFLVTLNCLLNMLFKIDL